MSTTGFDFQPTEAGKEIEMPEEFEEEIVETANSWNYPGDADGRDIHVNSDNGRIKVVEYEDDVEVYDQGAGIEGFRAAFPRVFQGRFGYQRAFDSGYDKAVNAAEGDVEVFEFDDGDVVIAGERSAVRDTVFEARQGLGREYGEKSSWNVSEVEEPEKAVLADGGFPSYDGSRSVETSEVESENRDSYMGRFTTP